VTLFLAWGILSLFVGVAANSRGRNGVGWFLISLLISPLFGLLFLIAMPIKTPRLPPKRASGMFNLGRTTTTAIRGKKCPRCAEIVKPDAKVCRFCGHSFDLQARIGEIEA